MVNKRCAFSGCGNRSSNTRNLSFHTVHITKLSSFRDLEKWKQVCGVEEFEKNAVVCGQHFDDAAFVNPKCKSQGLIVTAVPSRNPKPLPFAAVNVAGVATNVPCKVEDDSNKPSKTPAEGQKSLNNSPSKIRPVLAVRQDLKLLKKETPVRIDPPPQADLGETFKAIKIIPRTIKPTKKITDDLLKKITCRMCLRTAGGGPGISVFSPFAGKRCLAEIIKLCFGIRIMKKEFCTNICDGCLVKVDIVWRLYREFQVHRMAVEEFYSAQKVTKITIQPVVQPDSVPDDDRVVEDSISLEVKEDNVQVNDVVRSDPDPVPDSPPPVKKRKKKVADPEGSDSDSYSLPEDPFFTRPTKKPYCCHLCPKRFKRDAQLSNHLTYQHRSANRERLCEYCAKIVHQYKFYNHLGRHLEKRELKTVMCPTCGKVINNSQNLRCHMLVHTKERPVACTLCDKRFTETGYLRLHVQREHPSIEFDPNPPEREKSTFKDGVIRTYRLPCPVCGETFKSGPKLIGHVKATHPDHPLDVIQCEQCPQRFTSLVQLRSHTLAFHLGKKYECHQCGRIFRAPGQLRAHLQKHEYEARTKGDDDDEGGGGVNE